MISLLLLLKLGSCAGGMVALYFGMGAPPALIRR